MIGFFRVLNHSCHSCRRSEISSPSSYCPQAEMLSMIAGICPSFSLEEGQRVNSQVHRQIPQHRTLTVSSHVRVRRRFGSLSVQKPPLQQQTPSIPNHNRLLISNNNSGRLSLHGVYAAWTYCPRPYSIRIPTHLAGIALPSTGPAGQRPQSARAPQAQMHGPSIARLGVGARSR